MIWRWLHRHPRLVDVSIVVVLLAGSIVAATQYRHDRAAALALGVVEVLPLLWRRSHPVETTLLVASASTAMIALDVWRVPLQLGVALYTLGSTRTGRRDIGVGAGVVAAVGISVLAAGGLEFGAAAARVVFLAAALLLGESIGSRRAYVSEIEDKAARLEREQATERRRATAEEQARIAREFHDVLAHALSVVVVQTSAATDSFERDPPAARAALDAVEHAARAALADLRRVLGMLDGGPEYEPQPGIQRIDDLVASVRATGLAVSLAIEGTPESLPATLDLSAYRIVQEALTNTLKHADATRVDVRVRYRADALDVEILDDGRGTNGTPAAAGSGVVGMQERAALLGGTLHAGPADGGGYRVTATLPLQAPE